MGYEELIIEAENNGIKIKERSLNYGFKGLYKNGKILIDNKISDNEKACVLVEELGHHYTSFGNIIDLKDIDNVRQEKRARNWGYEKLVGIIDLINAYNKGISGRNNLAEYLSVTEQFLEEVITHYKEKYGVYYEIDNYIIYFEPLTVVKML